MLNATEVIAERVFKIEGNFEATVKISIYRPILDGDDFKCNYRIEWPEIVHEGHAYGVDSLQSLLLTINHISADLYSSEMVKLGIVYWLEPGNGIGLQKTF